MERETCYMFRNTISANPTDSNIENDFDPEPLADAINMAKDDFDLEMLCKNLAENPSAHGSLTAFEPFLVMVANYTCTTLTLTIDADKFTFLSPAQDVTVVKQRSELEQ